MKWYIQNQIMISDDGTRIIGVADDMRNEIDKVVIPEGVTTIEPQAFHRCWNLTSVQFPSTLKTIGAEAFWHCFSLKEFVLPEGLKTIEAEAFNGCANKPGIVVDIRIPASVENIGEEAFALSGIDRIEVEPDNPHYFSRDGVLYKRDSHENVLVSFQRKGLDTFTVDADITALGTLSFMGCNVKTVILHDEMKSLGEERTFWLSKIEQIELPASIQRIPPACFGGCVELKYVKITQAKDAEFYIGAEALKCSPLEELHVHATDLSKFKVVKSAFRSDQYKKTTLYVSGCSIEEFRQHPVFGKFKKIKGEWDHLGIVNILGDPIIAFPNGMKGN